MSFLDTLEDTVPYFMTLDDDWMVSDSLNRAEKTVSKAMPKTEFIHQYVKSMGGQVLTEKEHPEFVRHIHDMAKELKLPYKPIIAVTDRIPIGPVWMHHFPNLAALPNEGLVFCNKAMLNMCKSSTHTAPSPALKSWFAHELSHLKHDSGGTIISHYSGIVLPAAAMMGLYIYDKAMKKTPEDKNILVNMNQEIHTIADHELKLLDDEQKKDRINNPWRMEPAIHKPIIEASRYLAAGALGLVGAYLLRRHISLAREFRADKVAVELVKAPEAFKQSLIEIEHAHMEGARKIFTNPKQLETIKPKTMKEHLELGKTLLDIYTTHAHPKLSERLTHVDKVAANMLAKSHATPASI